MSERLGDLPPGWEELEREDTDSLAPPEGAKERVEARVALTLGLGAGFAVATAASSTAAAAAVATSTAGSSTAAAGTTAAAGGAGGAGATATGIAGTLLAKKALVLGVAAAVGVGGGTAAYLEVRSERARSNPAAVAPPPPVHAPAALPAAPPAPEPPAEEPPAVEDTLGEERALLDRARQEIVHGKLREAGALLASHAEKFPAGQLREEREALTIRLLVREGRLAEARSRAARFRQEHPRSIQLPGIGEALREHW
jgi:hypothetical protein